jgi:hypothetical protein
MSTKYSYEKHKSSSVIINFSSKTVRRSYFFSYLLGSGQPHISGSFALLQSHKIHQSDGTLRKIAEMELGQFEAAR